jgi:hypothetical protein
MEQSANSFTTSHAAPCKSGAKVVECDQTSVLATFIMLLRGRSETTVTKAVHLPLTSEVQQWKPYWLFYWCCFCWEAGAGDTVVTAASAIEKRGLRQRPLCSQ